MTYADCGVYGPLLQWGVESRLAFLQILPPDRNNYCANRAIDYKGWRRPL
jgi:hypothetical protein